MSKAIRTWCVDPLTRTMNYRMSVEVNGRQLVAQISESDSARFMLDPMPPDYIERNLRHQLLRELEDHLIGPRV